jgi:hypothetical protein
MNGILSKDKSVPIARMFPIIINNIFLRLFELLNKNIANIDNNENFCI